jgi:DNA-binding Lrp family transcriptional regulator
MNGAFTSRRGEMIAMSKLDSMDRKILNILQNDFPLTPHPYQDIAAMLAITEDEVIERISRIKNQGIIRRIGAILDSSRMGYYSTLCACQVEARRIDEVTGVINTYKGVTHNYVRDHQYNIWFTLTALSYEDALSIIQTIEESAGVKVFSMPALKKYKIKVSLEMGGNSDNG